MKGQKVFIGKKTLMGANFVNIHLQVGVIDIEMSILKVDNLAQIACLVP